MKEYRHKEMTKEQQISFRAMCNNDMPAIERWLNREHVRKWFGEPQTWLDEINAKHDWLHYYIVEYENIPIGFCQYYDCCKMPKGLWEEEQPGSFGIDYCIGEEQYLNKGLGSVILQKLCETVIFTENPKQIIADPVKENLISIHLLEKNGFIFDGWTGLYKLAISQTLKEMSEFFNARAPIYEEKHIKHIGGMESKELVASFFPPYTQTMIDLGIGTGLELEAIFKRFPAIEVTGLDIAEDMLKTLAGKYPDRNIQLFCESYLTFDLGHCLYDVAISVMTLHHYNHQTKTDLYRRIHNCIKNNGIYVECDYMFSDIEYANPQKMEDLHFTEFERLKKELHITDDREYHYDTPCTVQNQKKMLLEAGFTNVREAYNRKNIVILIAYK